MTHPLDTIVTRENMSEVTRRIQNAIRSSLNDRLLDAPAATAALKMLPSAVKIGKPIGDAVTQIGKAVQQSLKRTGYKEHEPMRGVIRALTQPPIH